MIDGPCKWKRTIPLVDMIWYDWDEMEALALCVGSSYENSEECAWIIQRRCDPLYLGSCSTLCIASLMSLACHGWAFLFRRIRFWKDVKESQKLDIKCHMSCPRIPMIEHRSHKVRLSLSIRYFVHLFFRESYRVSLDIISPPIYFMTADNDNNGRLLENIRPDTLSPGINESWRHMGPWVEQCNSRCKSLLYKLGHLRSPSERPRTNSLPTIVSNGLTRPVRS